MTTQSPARTRRVVLIDDHPLIRQGLERLISFGDRFQVCGEAGDAALGLKIIRELKPDLAIVDISLPDGDGIALTKSIVTELPDVRVLVLSMHDDADSAQRAFRAGATGYMVKNDASEKIETALEEVWNRRRYISDSVATQMGAT
jgi:DNA-binding NarL/FixJ family response regulator